MENPEVRRYGGTLTFGGHVGNNLNCKTNALSHSMKEELTVEKLKGVKLWITAGPREKFTASEVMYRDMISFVILKRVFFFI